MLIKSKIKYIQSLSQKKLRDEQGVFVAEGPKIISELLSTSNVEVQQLFAVKCWIEQNQTKNKVPIHEISQSQLAQISSLSTPNQVVGIFHKPRFPAPTHFEGKITLLLDAIQDPGNMGSIIRCADWFGVELVVCSKDCADVFNPKTVQSTMGSISRVQVLYEDLHQFIKSKATIPVYAATLEGIPITNTDRLQQGFILIGNESKGIKPELLSLSTKRITIPRLGKAESLNAAVATGIVLSHLVAGD